MHREINSEGSGHLNPDTELNYAGLQEKVLYIDNDEIIKYLYSNI